MASVPCPSFLRAAGALSASVALLLAAPGCSGKACDTSIALSPVTMVRDVDVAYAQIDRAAIDVCVAGTCARAGAADGSGTYQLYVGGQKAKLRLGSEDGGRTQVALDVTLSEHSGTIEVKVVLHDSAGAEHVAGGTVAFHETANECHSVADRTTI